MIARGRAAHPDLDSRHVEPGPLPFDDASFDAALLFAVLTSIPSAEHQQALVAEVERVLVPGGLLFVSDLWMQDDDRNRARYAAGERVHGTRGVFEHPEGAAFRHPDREWLEDLRLGRETLSLRDVDVTTMNGNAGRLPAAGSPAARDDRIPARG